MSADGAPRALGSPPPPRRRFVAPAAVRFAQLALLVRIAAVLAVVLSLGRSAGSPVVVVDGTHLVTLPGASTWTMLAPGVLAASVFEAVLTLRLGVLGTWSRRLVLLVEAAAIAVSGVYVAGGVRGALVVLVASIAGVVLLRLDHVRHSFAKAAHERGLVGRKVTSSLFDGYRLPDPTLRQPAQPVGYRLRDEVTRDA